MGKIPIYVINLKKDIHKREHMQELCKKHSLMCHFIDAIYGQDLSDTYAVYDKGGALKKFGRELTPGEIGCALSHITIYNKMLETGNNIAIVFEDDIVIEADFKNVIDSISKFPTDWECVLLGYSSDGLGEVASLSSFWWRKKISRVSSIVRLVGRVYGSYGYVINLKGARKLLTNMSVLSKPVDCYIGDDKRMNLYGINPRSIGVTTTHFENSAIADDRTAMDKKYFHRTKEIQRIQRLKLFLKRIRLLYIIKKVRIVFIQMSDQLKNFLLKIQKPNAYDQKIRNESTKN